MQGQLFRAQKMEAIGTLAGGIAHDFNNILSAIIGYSVLAMAEVPGNSVLYSELESILHAGYRARELVRQILSISYRSEETRQVIDVVHLVREALKFLRAVLPSAIEIRQQLAADIYSVMANPTQLHQVVMNLCTNAAHAMAEEGGSLEVSLANVHFDSSFTSEGVTLEAGPYVQLTVRDSGVGIPQDTLQRIFDPYFTTKEKGKGTGLGLAVVQGVVRSHGGTLRVESEPDKGSKFTVFLPAVRDAAALLRPEQSMIVAAGSERILFIDDEEPIAHFGARALERLGYQVVAKTASLQALKLFRDKPAQFDLVITDLSMPGMTGDKLVHELLSIRADIPIILCTGFSEQVTEGQAKAMGAKAFLMKPLTIKILAETVRRVLDEER
jgi:CheY-like chemotaxis protein